MSEIATAADRDDTVSLLDLVRVLVRRRRLIVGLTFSGALLILGVLLLSLFLPSTSRWNPLPEIYRPEARVLLVEASGGASLLDNLSGAGLAGLAQLSGLGGSGHSAELAQELLAGRTLHDRIIDEFDFAGRYQLAGKPRARTSARSRVEGSLEYEYFPESQVLVLFYLDTDPAFATAVLARVLDLLEQRFRALTMETLLLKKQHLEERLQAVGADRQLAQDALVAFQRTHNSWELGPISAESPSLITLYVQQQLSQEMELQALLRYLPQDDPAVVQQRSQLEITTSVLEELRSELPVRAVEYLNLRRDLEIQESIHSLLRQQYELARIEETDTKRTFQILERPEVPELKYRPRRARIGIAGAIAVFMASVLLAFFLEYLVRAQADPVEAAKLAEIRRQLHPSSAPPPSSPSRSSD